MTVPTPRATEVAIADRLHPDNPGWSPTLARIRPPASVQNTALFLAVLLPVLTIAALILPWQQTASGTGQVIAYAPEERQQAVEAPISGRIERWYVQEGQRVEQGDPLVELRDIDPERLPRLLQQRVTAETQRAAAEAQIVSYQSKLQAALAAKDLVIAEKESQLQESRQKRAGEVAEAEAAGQNLTRTRTLAAEGIASTRELELAEMSDRKARSVLEARDQEIEAKRQARDKAAADADAKIAGVRAELQAAESKLAEAVSKLVDQDGSVARQSAQLVRAPRSGTLLRLHGGLGGGQLKAGEPVATLVPDASSRAVELYVDGNDMPFVAASGEARLVFEGWPALQFVGLPGTGQGTFGGRVDFVNASADAGGKFRVVVVPADGAIWPDGLRQGVRAKGFLLLGQVPLGYELWRQVNGFPPLPDVEKGDKPLLPGTKKPRAPTELK